MALLRCPRCDAALPLLPRWREWRRSVRHCPSCGAWLKPANMELVVGILGLVAGAAIVAAQGLGFWRLLLATVATVLLAVLLSRLVSWRVVPEGWEDPPAVRRWNRVLIACLVVAFASLLALWPIFWAHQRWFEANSARLSREQFDRAFLFLLAWPFGCLAVALAAGGLGLVAMVIQARARRAAMAGLEQGPEARP